GSSVSNNRIKISVACLSALCHIGSSIPRGIRHAVSPARPHLLHGPPRRSASGGRRSAAVVRGGAAQAAEKELDRARPAAQVHRRARCQESSPTRRGSSERPSKL